MRTIFGANDVDEDDLDAVLERERLEQARHVHQMKVDRLQRAEIGALEWMAMVPVLHRRVAWQQLSRRLQQRWPR